MGCVEVSVEPAEVAGRLGKAALVTLRGTLNEALERPMEGNPQEEEMGQEMGSGERRLWGEEGVWVLE